MKKTILGATLGIAFLSKSYENPILRALLGETLRNCLEAKISAQVLGAFLSQNWGGPHAVLLVPSSHCMSTLKRTLYTDVGKATRL